MERSERLNREALSLWRAMTTEPPPRDLRGARLLEAAMRQGAAAAGYDRLYSPYLRPSQIVRPR